MPDVITESLRRVWVRSFWKPDETLTRELRIYADQESAEDDLKHPQMHTYEILIIDHGPAAEPEEASHA